MGLDSLDLQLKDDHPGNPDNNLTEREIHQDSLVSTALLSNHGQQPKQMEESIPGAVEEVSMPAFLFDTIKTTEKAYAPDPNLHNGKSLQHCYF